MAITIDWGARVIFVPRADLTVVQVSPEIRQMDLDWFRLQLKDLEDDEGICYPDTHRHNTVVVIGGMTLARVIEIINGYTVTFEDGQYAVNLVGANSNVLDVVNFNQVSVRANNSAGMLVVSGGAIPPDLEAQLDQIQAVTDKVDTTLEQDGGVYRFTENALEQAPTGGGTGSGDISPAHVSVVAVRN